MLEILPLAIGIGLATSLLFSEAFGIAAGGMVVPGYLAVYLDRPLDVALTLGTGLATFVIVEGLSSFIVLYGRRRTALMLLMGYVLGSTVRWAATVSGVPLVAQTDVIGYIIPGLLALWFSRQGIVETVSAAATAATIVRLSLLILGAEEIAL